MPTLVRLAVRSVVELLRTPKRASHHTTHNTILVLVRFTVILVVALRLRVLKRTSRTAHDTVGELSPSPRNRSGRRRMSTASIETRCAAGWSK